MVFLKWVLSIDRTPSQRELRRPLIVSLARCALGLTRFGTSSGDRAFSREFGEFAEDPCHLSLAGHVLEATLCVPSLEVAMGNSSTINFEYGVAMGRLRTGIFIGLAGSYGGQACGESLI